MLDQAWDRLMRFPTRAYTRPLALVLQQGYIETWLTHTPRPKQYATSQPPHPYRMVCLVRRDSSRHKSNSSAMA